jgi:fatty-acyl-CoA synthase
VDSVRNQQSQQALQVCLSEQRGDRLMLSHSRGSDEPLWEKTIGQVLDQTVERSGDSLALVSRHQSKRYTWRELRDLADCVARGLPSLGIHPGDRVGLWSTNWVEWVMLQLGCARAGAILVNVNPASHA